MTAHVLIVDSRTFQVHLENLFIATGANREAFDINKVSSTLLHHSKENLQVSIASDLARIRKGDEIFFYCQNYRDQDGNKIEGKFYGVFEAKTQTGFLDNSGMGQTYLESDLGRYLPLRMGIVAKEVFSLGISEWEALDFFDAGQTADKMMWSLIYRKLEGNRGNTMITPFEAKELRNRIQLKNNGTSINHGRKQLSFDAQAQKIISTTKSPTKYTGSKESISLEKRLFEKMKRKQAFESHLQQYILAHLGSKKIESLNKLILDSRELQWLGNEVACRVCKQRIDILAMNLKVDSWMILPIELKATPLEVGHVAQVERYVDWIEKYLLPNHPGEIHPFLVTLSQDWDKTKNRKRKLEILLKRINDFNNKYKSKCKPLVWIEFQNNKSAITFAIQVGLPTVTAHSAAQP